MLLATSGAVHFQNEETFWQLQTQICGRGLAVGGSKPGSVQRCFTPKFRGPDLVTLLPNAGLSIDHQGQRSPTRRSGTSSSY